MSRPDLDTEWKFQRATCIASTVMLVMMLAVGWPLGSALTGMLVGATAVLWFVEWQEEAAR
jgi:hypothetical protein